MPGADGGGDGVHMIARGYCLDNWPVEPGPKSAFHMALDEGGFEFSGLSLLLPPVTGTAETAHRKEEREQA